MGSKKKEDTKKKDSKEDSKKDGKKDDSKKQKDSKKEDGKKDGKKDDKQKNTSQGKGVTCSASLLGKPNQNDCVAEKNNAVRNGQLDALYNRCRTEGGSRPIRVRRPQLCCKNWGENDGKKSGKKKNAGSAPPTSNKQGKGGKGEKGKDKKGKKNK